jgi:hypothetical protein
MRRSLSVLSRTVRVGFEIICGDAAERRMKTGTLRKRDSSSVPITARTFRRRHPDDMDLKCVFCLYVRKDNPEPAITIMNGQAVCDDHSYYVQGGEFARALTIIQRDELRNRNG